MSLAPDLDRMNVSSIRQPGPTYVYKEKFDEDMMFCLFPFDHYCLHYCHLCPTHIGSESESTDAKSVVLPSAVAGDDAY